MRSRLEEFREIWLVDFEFRADPGERPVVVCMVARELRSGRLLRIWWDILRHFSNAPFPVDPDVLFVAYYASAELGCFLVLNWTLPKNVLDLFAEFRNLTNGKSVPCGNGLVGAMAYHGIDSIEAAEKDELRQLAMRPGPHTEHERVALLEYCQSDVDALAKLLAEMSSHLDFERSLLRGRYMKAAAMMEHVGTPIDVETLSDLREHWDAIKTQLTAEINVEFGCYVPTGQRELNPDTAFGSAVLAAAHEHDIDPHHLAEVVDYVWQRERDEVQQWESAKTEARRRSGLNARVISQWENRLLDYSSYPGLDTTAREIALELPELGLGAGEETGGGVDETDYAAALWDLLAEPKRTPMRRHDPEIIHAALDLLLANPAQEYCGPLSFSAKRFADYLTQNDIPWPRTPAGQLSLSDETFREMVKRYPQLAPLRELRLSLGQMRLNDLAVGSDGRNRCLLSAFRSRTGRNQPSNSRFIFGPSVWLRSLIKPQAGRAIAYVDWEQQEFGIAAAFSNDANMQEAYRSGDPYLTFAKQARAVPDNATKQSHPQERSRFKVCALAVQYGMGAKSLSAALGEPECVGRELLRLHRMTYPAFWEWSQAAVDHAMLHGYLQTVFGWKIQVGERVNPRSLANFPCQANGAEMLRLACCLLTEAGINVNAPVHDAVLVESEARLIDDTVKQTQRIMMEASEVILDGFTIQTDAEIVRFPDRYCDDRGKEMWDAVTSVLRVCT